MKIKNKNESMTLAELRKSLGKSQTQVAKRLGMDQPNLSRFEKGKDHKLSALAEYAQALGGRLEISFVFPEQK